MSVPDPLDFITQAVRRRLTEIRHESWQREFRQLQRDVYATGGFGLGETKGEVLENLREIRQQIFEEEYALMYGASSVGKDDRG